MASTAVVSISLAQAVIVQTKAKNNKVIFFIIVVLFL